MRCKRVLTILFCIALLCSGCSVIGNQNRDTTDDVPPFSGEPYIELNNDVPNFTSEEKQCRTAFEFYSELDGLGRCGTAYANVCQELMPTEERGEIGQIRPSGWKLVKYDIVEGNYLYNRCHLIAYQLAGENANEKNLITGTRYFNATGMLFFENQVAEYVKATGNHVLYRVTPIYRGNDLVAAGVRMEAYSVEDNGDGVCFHVFVYNVQPGISIDYATGESSLAIDGNAVETEAEIALNKNATDEKTENISEEVHTVDDTSADTGKSEADSQAYVLNRNTKKFHRPSCESVNDIKEKNKKEVVGSREEIMGEGYVPCKRCNP
ncbi:MAG: DNA/RNA non-specific endonuclease [Clostridium sp.]|nr:DNA/RNA non-specific endonuclease [Clostridium sp.]MCM1459162.1 DNA/RNA non-specific endonuclease [Bacteroides sp.]